MMHALQVVAVLALAAIVIRDIWLLCTKHRKDKE